MGYKESDTAEQPTLSLRYTLPYLKWIINKDLLITQGTLLSVLGSLDGRRVWERMDTRMTESLHWPPETITALLMGCTPTQKVKMKKTKRST